MNNHETSLFIIGVILLFIIAAFIFKKEFREDVINSKGEAKILGLASVKGVIIILLVAIFGGIFSYILYLENISKNGELTTSKAINYLQKSNDVTYLINNDDGAINILANNKIIGSLKNNTNKKLIVSKSANDYKQWNIGLLNSTLGFVTVNGEDGYVKWDERDSEERMIYKIKEPYKIKNLDLWFRIDSIINETKNDKKYSYVLSFGEGENINNVEWSDLSEKFSKTPDGKIYINEEFKPIRFYGWQNDYYVKFAAGQPSTEKPVLYSVEKLNMIAVSLRLK